jgi:hypothetical protein
MGVWGTGPTQSDDAYDLFKLFYGDLFGPKKIQLLRNALRYYDAYAAIQAAAFILQMLGENLFWPRKYQGELKELLDLAILRLTEMITPVDGKPTEFISLWSEEDAKDAVKSVQQQIDDLRSKRELL